MSEPALELLFRACSGNPRVASKSVRAALCCAHEHNQTIIEERIIEEVLSSLGAHVKT